MRETGHRIINQAESPQSFCHRSGHEGSQITARQARIFSPIHSFRSYIKLSFLIFLFPFTDVFQHSVEALPVACFIVCTVEERDAALLLFICDFELSEGHTQI